MMEERGFQERPARKSRRETRQERERTKKRGGSLFELIIIVLVAFVLVFGFIRPFVVEAYRIPSESMVPTLEIGDRVLANKFIYRFTQPERGDVVVFDSIKKKKDDILIKRVAGTAGDEVQVRGGVLFVNREEQDEPYLNQALQDQSSPYGPETVPEGHVFVLGDNRGNSGDSRIFGPVPLENVKGRGVVVFWPPTRLGLL